MSDKWVKEGQKQLDDMLMTLHQSGFITLMLENGEEYVHERHENLLE